MVKRGEKQELALLLKQSLFVSFQYYIAKRHQWPPNPLSGNKHAAIVNAYAPTMTNPDEVKDKLVARIPLHFNLMSTSPEFFIVTKIIFI